MYVCIALRVKEVEEIMGNLINCQFWYTLVFVLSVQGKAFCSNTFKVGDLDGWGIPTSNPQLYTTWSNHHNLSIGDSLFFLYPPSKDSLIQVTKDSYNNCNLKDPILYMNDGNSLFNITRSGEYYFTSGVDGHCLKSQKLHVSVYGNGSSEADSPAADGPSASAPSYPTVFGSIPVQASASPLLELPVFLAMAAAAAAAAGIFLS